MCSDTLSQRETKEKHDHRIRITPEENELVSLLAKTESITKQEYIMPKPTNTSTIAYPNTCTYKALKDGQGIC